MIHHKTTNVVGKYSRVSDSLRRKISRIVGDNHLTDRPERLHAYARDAWPRVLLAAREGLPLCGPDLVVWPANEEETSEVVRLARSESCPIIAYGAGSGVCGGTYPLHGGIAIDVKRMDNVGLVDPSDRLVEVGAGALGEHLERKLLAQGYTLGHFPSSIYCSTLGGWIAARSAGQMSSRYGKIEDMVSGLTFVDGTGTIRSVEAGPGGRDRNQLVQSIIGSEGVLGIVTRAFLRVRKVPSVRLMRGVLIPSLEAGVGTIRQIMQSGLRPAVIRLYDPMDTLVNKGKGTPSGSGVVSTIRKSIGRAINGGNTGKSNKWFIKAPVRMFLTCPSFFGSILERFSGSCMLVLGFEGQDQELVGDELAEALDICKAFGGEDLGEGPGKHWLEHRYSVSFKLTPALDMGLFVDTLETACTWDKLLGVYCAAYEAIKRHGLGMAHLSHAYEDGCSIYFTFAGTASGLLASERAYDSLWEDVLDAVVSSGATVSHHHGVGMSKQSFMIREHGESGLRLLGALKKALDPDGIMNPGKLGLGGGPSLPGSDWTLACDGPFDSSDHKKHEACGDDGSLDQNNAFRLNAESLIVTAAADIEANRLEEELNLSGYTLGYRDLPALSLSRWLADDEPGPACSRSYPGWSPVMALKAVLPDGTLIETLKSPRSASGPDLKSLLLGHGGMLGIITEVTLRVFPLAKGKRACVDFGSMAKAIEATVESLAMDLVPDRFHLFERRGASAQTRLVWERRGSPARIAREVDLVSEISRSKGGRIVSIVDEETRGIAQDEESLALECESDLTEKIGFASSWSRLPLLNREVMKAVKKDRFCMSLEKALPEGALGRICVDSKALEPVKKAILKAGVRLLQDDCPDSWVQDVAKAMNGDGR